MRSGPSRRVLHAGGEFRLICLPFAGGSAQSFQPLARAAAEDGTDWTIVAAQPPSGAGLDLDRLAGHYLELLDGDLCGEGLLFGHSLGAAVAHRMAELLGPAWPPGLSLVLSAPAVPRTSLRHLTLLDDHAFLTEVTRRGLFQPPPVSQDVLNRFVLPTLRRDLRVLPERGWVPLPVTPATDVIGGTQDSLVGPDILERIRQEVRARSLRMVDGGHLYPVDQPDRTWAELVAVASGSATLLRRGA